jgi:hypothetical protein
VNEAQGQRTLQVVEDLRFQQREWRAGTITWVGLIAIMAATVAGLFGNGPLSRARSGGPSDPIRVEYARFSRFGASQRLVVHLRTPEGGEPTLVMGRALADAFRIVQVTPPPVTVRLLVDGLEYRFNAAPEGAAIVFELQPARRWLVRSAVRAGGAEARVTQFVYP